MSVSLLFLAGGCGNAAPQGIEQANVTESESEALSSSVRRFRVSVRNVTAGNGISPLFVAVHQESFDLLKTGEPASQGVADVAELGRTDVLKSEILDADSYAVTAKAEGPATAGKTVSVDIEVPLNVLAHGGKLDFIAMIGRSNDSFIAAPNAIDISGLARGSRITFAATNFDAGSEENTGNVVDFGPGGHPVAALKGLSATIAG